MKMRALFIMACICVSVLAGTFPVLAQRQVSYALNSPSSTDKSADSIQITAYDNKIVVHNAPIGSKLEIYSVVGIRVKEILLKQAYGEYPVDLAKGYYIVRIGETVRKVAIR